MKLKHKLLIGSALGLAMSIPAFAAPTDVIATVNGSKILQKDVDNYIQEFRLSPEQAQQRDLIIDELVSRQLVYQDAIKKKLDKRPEVIAELEQIKSKVLLNAAVKEAANAKPISEDEIKKEYELQLPKMQQQEYKARHILVKTEEEANNLLTALARGADFSTLANEKSLDTSAKDGDLGWFPANQMVPPFA
ncbi:MAG: peptidylprolyl isomerase [Thiohalomonadaceae bacterium]